MADKTAKPAEGKSPENRHPLMINGQSWDRPAVMAILCEAIATSTASIATILSNGHEGHTLPEYKAISRWLTEDETLRQQYARAKEDQADHMAEEMLEISDDASNDYMERTGKDSDAGYALNGEHIQRSRLRVDTRKWLASKLKPKKYGDKLDLNHGGKLELIDQRQRDAAVAAAQAAHPNNHTPSKE